MIINTWARAAAFLFLLVVGAKRPPHRSARRLLLEWSNVQKEGSALGIQDGNETSIRLCPVHGNMHEWHFSFTGCPNSPYEGGIYHGRFILPAAYPREPPRVQMHTESGRFRVGTDICLSASSFHQESWSTHWTLHKLATALRLHMLTRAGEIGGIDCSEELRRALASASREFMCQKCACCHRELWAR